MKIEDVDNELSEDAWADRGLTRPPSRHIRGGKADQLANTNAQLFGGCVRSRSDSLNNQMCTASN